MLARLRPALPRRRRRPCRGRRVARRRRARVARCVTLEDLARLAASEPATRSTWPSPRTTPMSCSTRAARRGRPRGRCSRIGSTCCARCPGALLEPRGAMVCPYPLFHMGAWTIALQQWQARDAVVFVRSATAGGDRERRGAPPGHPPQLRPRRVAAAARRTSAGTGRAGPLVDPLRRHRAPRPRRPSSSGPSPTRSPTRRCASSTGPPRPGASPSSSTPTSSASRAAAVCPGPLTTVRVDARRSTVGARPAALRRLPRRPRAPRRRRWSTAGTTPATWPTSTTTATSRSSGRAGDVIRTGGEAVAPAEVEAVLAGPSGGGRRGRGRALPDPQWGEVVCAVVVVGSRRGRLPTWTTSGPSARAGWPRTSTPAGWTIVDEIPRTAATGQVQRRLLVERLASRRRAG